MDICQLKACDLANLGSPPQAGKFRTFDPKYRQKFLKGSRLNRDLKKKHAEAGNFKENIVF